jgi:flagellar biosynthesis protein FlhF
MAIRKFVAPTTREAMMQVRRELGEDAVIIANRRAGNRIEILAAAPDAVDALVERSETRAAAPQRERVAAHEQPASREPSRPKEESFQEFVRRQMQTDVEAPPPQRAAREAPARARVAPAGRTLGTNTGVAMYHDVADIEPEDFAAGELQETEPAPARAPATTLRHSHRAQQIESVAPAADPAVFRRRPATVAPAPAAVRVASRAPTIDIVLEPQSPQPAPAVQAPAVAAAPQPRIEPAPVESPPMLTGHAVVPSLPVRSQAAPIATAARLREASINAAAAAAAQSARRAVPVKAEMPAPPLAAWSWEAQFIEAPTTPSEPQQESAPAPSAQAPVANVPPAQPAQPIQAAVPAQPAHAAPAQPVQATTIVQPAQPLQAAAPVQPMQAAVVAQPAQAAQVAVPVQPAQAAQVTLPMQPAQPMQVAVSVQPAQPLQATGPVHPAEPAAPRMESQLLAELHSMRDMLRQQLATLAIKPVAPEPIPAGSAATRVVTRLLSAGFSAEVARRIGAHVAPHADVSQAESWLQEVLAHNIRCAEPTDGIVERAGRPATPGQTFALVGPTGVGKTTTVAKLAARFAVRHGTSALGLITLDAYRIAAPEQLRGYGRILGTPVHLAQDLPTLREMLATMVHKRLILIDTCGVSQRDERLAEMLDLLANAGSTNRPVQRVLLMNSASHAETLEEAARAWRAQECIGAILTKLDEATRIGGSLDISLRHRLTLLGLTNGQRVPEDWHAANGKLLAHLALKPATQLFEIADEEGAALLQAQAHNAARRSATHA